MKLPRAQTSGLQLACLEPLPGRPAGAQQRLRGEGSQGGSRQSGPETNAATGWQWREFYYYPIITLGSELK